jgi:hypothetical protein
MIQVDCPICYPNYSGIVIIRKENYDCVYQCTCWAGIEKDYDGQKCSRRTQYYLPKIDSLPSGIIDEIIKDNCKRYGLVIKDGKYYKDSEKMLSKEQIQEYREQLIELVKYMEGK